MIDFFPLSYSGTVFTFVTIGRSIHIILMIKDFTLYHTIPTLNNT